MLAKTRPAGQATRLQCHRSRITSTGRGPYQSTCAMSSGQVAGLDWGEGQKASNASWAAGEQLSRRDKAHFVAREQWDGRPR